MRPPKEGIKIKINEGEQYDISLVAQVEHYQAYLPPVAGPPVPRRATARAAAS